MRESPGAETVVPSAAPPFHLIYRSRSKLPPGSGQQELGHILRKSRANNAASGVTGALLMYDNWFAQVLEGPEPTVRALYDRIKADERHDAVQVEQACAVEMRAFSRWAMANVGEHGEADMPLVAVPDGVIEGGAWKTETAAQEQILTVLRDLTRGYGRGS